MPPPDRTLAAVRRAVALTAATPGRCGRLVRLPAACTDVVVAGDLHGHVDNFRVVYQAADLAAHPGRHLVLQELVHGPFRYPKGGDKSHQAVDLFCFLKCQFPDRVHLLPGNHELAEWTGRAVGKGDGGGSLNDLFRAGLREAYGAAAGDIHRAYRDLFRASPLGVRTPNAVWLSHTLPAARWVPQFDPSRLERDAYPEADDLPGGMVYALLWGRDTDAATAADFLRKVDADLLVTGHVRAEAGFAVPGPRHLIVDTSSRPAAYLRLPADRPVTLADLVAGVARF